MTNNDLLGFLSKATFTLTKTYIFWAKIYLETKLSPVSVYSRHNSIIVILMPSLSIDVSAAAGACPPPHPLPCQSQLPAQLSPGVRMPIITHLTSLRGPYYYFATKTKMFLKIVVILYFF